MDAARGAAGYRRAFPRRLHEFGQPRGHRHALALGGRHRRHRQRGRSRGREPVRPANGAGTGSATPFDWKNNAAQVETALNQISEIADSRVVVSGTTALVAVRYTDAYQGDTTERIREMVAGVVREADPTIQTVAVTSEEDDVTDVYAISDRIRAGENAADMAEEIDRIVRNPTTLR